MPAPVTITRSRRVNGDHLDPLPPGTTPTVTADEAWRSLRRARAATGGGSEELLLGRFSGRGYSRVPAWVRFSSHVAQRLEPLSPQPGLTPQREGEPCVFVDVLTVLDARTGQRFYGSTVTSSGPPPMPASTPAETRPDPQARVVGET